MHGCTATLCGRTGAPPHIAQVNPKITLPWHACKRTPLHSPCVLPGVGQGQCPSQRAVSCLPARHACCSNLHWGHSVASRGAAAPQPPHPRAYRRAVRVSVGAANGRRAGGVARPAAPVLLDPEGESHAELRLQMSSDSKCVPPPPSPPPPSSYLCSSFLRLTQTARCGPCGTHTLCRLHFTFWHGSLVLSSPGEQGEEGRLGAPRECSRARLRLPEAGTGPRSPLQPTPTPPSVPSSGGCPSSQLRM